MHPLRKEMAQMGNADAQGPGDAQEGDLLKGVVGDVLDDPESQTPLAVIIDGAVGQAVEHAGQHHVQVAHAQGQAGFHVHLAQPVHRQPQIEAGPGGGQHRILRQQPVKGVGIFRNQIRGEDGGHSPGVLLQPVIAVGDQGEDHDGVPGGQPVGFFVHGQHRGSLGQGQQLRHVVDVGGHGTAGHLPDKELLGTLLIICGHRSVSSGVFAFFGSAPSAEGG